MNSCILNNQSESCLPKKIIKDLGKKYLPNDKEQNILSHILIIDKLATTLNCNNLDTTSSKEICIIEKIKLKNKGSNDEKVLNKTLLSYFKPLTKSFNGDYWMNNTDIDSIQYQFHILFPGYYYSNIHMIDLVMYNPGNTHLMKNGHKIKPIKEINFINELEKKNHELNYNKELQNYGMVINTDVSSGGGIHWFSIFIDFKSTPIKIEYFNSSGYDITNVKFKTYFMNLADEITREFRKCIFVKVTNIQHQRANTANCGSYSLYFIWKRLNGVPYDYFSKNKITDENMVGFRKFLFRLK